MKAATILLVLAVAASCPAMSAPVQNPANGHYYDVVHQPIDWEAARTASEALVVLGTPGHLAIVESADENLFLTNTFGAAVIHYHWIGGYQLPGSIEPAQGWTWISGDPLAFDNWSPGEPNEFFGGSPNEDRIAYDHAVDGEGKHWNDLPGSFLLDGYVVEFPVPPNQPPDCSAARASVDQLWPPNHRLVPIDVEGVTDPDGNAMTITVTGITQDEPLNTRGDGNTCPDAQIVDGQASVRAERGGSSGIPGNGRVYTLFFTATDGRGGECNGTVTVCVPHDRGQGSECIDDGQTYNSLGPCNGGLQSRTEITKAELTVGPMTGSQATVEFSLPQATPVELSVFDVAGRHVVTVASGTMEAGLHQRVWNLSGAMKGLYFVRLRTAEATLTRTVVKTR